MTTWTLKLTPPDGPETETTGLSREQAFGALSDLVHGRTGNLVPAAPSEAAERDPALPPAA